MERQPLQQMNDDLQDLIDKLVGDEAEELASKLIEGYGDSIRVNTLKIGEAELLSILRGQGWSLERIPWTRYGYRVLKCDGNPGNTIEHSLGFYYVQGPASMAPVEVLLPVPGEVVLDMCASPGSKTTQIAQELKGDGVVVANDVSRGRLKPLSSNLQRCGVLNCVVTLADGRVFWRWGRNMFDKVLLDAPCSSLGIIIRSPRVAGRWTYRRSLRFAKVQSRLLLSAFDCTKPGGTLVYSTCTIVPEENEEVVSFLLSARENAQLADINLQGLISRQGITDWNGKLYPETLSKSCRIYPQENGSEAFYVAKIVKASD